MANIWLISDTHFGHANTFLKFKVKCRACYGTGYRESSPHDADICRPHCSDCDGAGEVPMRPFTSVEEMDETMVTRWNEVVQPRDKVYHLGDAVLRSSNFPILARLQGHKRLVLGNHDTGYVQQLVPYFEKIYGSRELDHVLLTHIPIHPQSFLGKVRGNVHGHVHNNQHRTTSALPCPPYVNVCVEVTDYRPVAFEAVKQQLGLTG